MTLTDFPSNREEDLTRVEIYSLCQLTSISRESRSISFSLTSRLINLSYQWLDLASDGSLEMAYLYLTY